MSFLRNLESCYTAHKRNRSCQGKTILVQCDERFVTAYVAPYLLPVTSAILSEAARDSDNLSIKRRHALINTPADGKKMHECAQVDSSCVRNCVCNPEKFTTRQINARTYILDDIEQQDDATKNRIPRYNDATEKTILRKQVKEDGIHFSLRRSEAFLWIQFSYLPKMYGCGWGKSYSLNERIMAVQITMPGFVEMLRLYANDRLYHISKGDVKMEWAPDQSPMGKELHRSFIRIGIRGDILTLFDKYWLFSITDITSFVKRQSGCVQRGQLSCIWTPLERVYIPASPAVCRFLGVKHEEPAPVDQTNEDTVRESASATFIGANSKLHSFGHKQEVILYLFGAFNPIHSGHVNAIVACKKWLENTKKCNVSETFIGIMSDSALQSKLCNRPMDFCIKFDHRRNLCEIACSDHSWIQVYPLQCKGQKHFGVELRKTLNKPNATLGFIIGSDYVIQSPGSYKYLREHNKVLLCVGRKGMKAAEKVAFDLVKKNNPLQPHEIYIVPTVPNDINSTAIRQTLMKVNDYYTEDGKKQSNLTMIVEELIKLNWIQECGGRYICRHFDDLKEEEQIFATCGEVQLM